MDNCLVNSQHLNQPVCQHASSLSNRAYCYAELAVFCPAAAMSITSTIHVLALTHIMVEYKLGWCCKKTLYCLFRTSHSVRRLIHCVSSCGHRLRK